MIPLQRYSEPYSATGGQAAEGVLNHLGRPNIEALEVLVREAVQNCWDAKQPDARGITVEIGRRTLSGTELEDVRDLVLVDPPPKLALREALENDLDLLYFADFGTEGLGGPTRADQPGSVRDFVDFVRNIGQPPDKDLGGGSFGYGKAAFYIASNANTILIDTLCLNEHGDLERRFLGCALGDNHTVDGRPYTGRHWWGRLKDGVPEPLIDADADAAAELLGLPARRGPDDLGTTVVIVAPGVEPEGLSSRDDVMRFIGESLAWNFWPRMVDSPGAAKRSMAFRLLDQGVRVRVPDPRTHDRLKGFVEALDRLREEPGPDDDLLYDRSIECLRPAQRLGRLVIQRGIVAPIEEVGTAVPQGARLTADAVHHVALMRNAELVVRYLPGPVPITGRMGYSGVFKCAIDVDAAFRAAEPPTHDDWVFRAVPKGHSRTFVKVALERIAGVSRDAAGYDLAVTSAPGDGSHVPLGEFADALASLMPGSEGPGARRGKRVAKTPRKKRTRPGQTAVVDAADGVWVDGEVARTGEEVPGTDAPDVVDAGPDGPEGPAQKPPKPRRLPQARTGGEPILALGVDGMPVVRYPFQLRTNENTVRLTAHVEVMANDGSQVEDGAPLGAVTPQVRAWTSPSGTTSQGATAEVGADDGDGLWTVEVELVEETMVRIDLMPEVIG